MSLEKLPPPSWTENFNIPIYKAGESYVHFHFKNECTVNLHMSNEMVPFVCLFLLLEIASRTI